MSIVGKIESAKFADPMVVFGHGDSSLSRYVGHTYTGSTIRSGVVRQFNVGLYSALVEDYGGSRKSYICEIGAFSITIGFGYSDANLLSEGDDVLFAVESEQSRSGIILAKRPAKYGKSPVHPLKVKSETDQQRRTSFFSNDCYRKANAPYSVPLSYKYDVSTQINTSNRPTDLVPGEIGTLNQHHCGILGGLFSTTLAGGGAHIKLFSLENRIRIVADSMIRHTMCGNQEEWHNGRRLSIERSTCLYQEERLGTKPGTPPFDSADYDKDGYFTKNSKKKQSSRPRIFEMQGFYGGLSSRYFLRPDTEESNVRSLEEDSPKDQGVIRESMDPSGQYRIAASGMLGLERIGRIPVPVRIKKPWQKDVDPDRKDDKLEEFKHNEEHPFYRQLELADRIAYDLKNSYSRVDESEEFEVPEEEELKELEDVYDPGFSESTTVKLRKYDKRRSGIWQGEDGSVIIRDAWGSEIVMIGGNIQLSCAGNVQIMPGKTALTIAGDDIVQKAQNSIDIQSADKDVRINAVKNVQIMSGIDDDHPGGITLESKGKSGPWGKSSEKLSGESMPTSGIFLKSESGSVAADAKNIMLRSRSITSIVSAKDDQISDGEGSIFMSAKGVYTRGDNVISTTGDSHMILGKTSAIVTGRSAGVVGANSAFVLKGEQAMVPLMWVDIGTDVYNEIDTGIDPLVVMMETEQQVGLGYSAEELDQMHFKFRSSSECGTTGSWEIGGSGKFTMYEPFWAQVNTKFETLKGIKTKGIEDHFALWDEDTGHPWPGKDAIDSGRYAMLTRGPQNIGDTGLNVPRSQVKDKSDIIECPLESYLVRG